MRRGSALLTVIMLAGCSTGEAPAPRTTAGAPSAGDTTQTITVGDKVRTFQLHVPASYDPGRPMPAVVALHHKPGSGATMRELTGLDAKADKEGFIVAYPEGVGGQFNAFGCCGVQDDIGFVKAVAGQLVERWKADPDRVFLAGVSNGADLSFRAAVEAPGVFAAIGAVSGGFTGGRTEAADYRPPAPVSVVTLIGAADPQATTFRTGLDTWRARASCAKPFVPPPPSANAPVTVPPPGSVSAPPPSPAAPLDPAVQRTTTPCKGGSDVDTYVIDGAGHVWFGATAGELKDPAPKIDATDVLWAFFAVHPRHG
ncbi:PHB depolymerase family esterase [Dactylosporangium sp. NPDC005555]|uniref:alpha/beta hydrolase family esterase n=1 Tax=Dactylosporangium sp. NPDC005555 TaxID=3154889 RepID=UPI0033A0D8C1